MARLTLELLGPARIRLDGHSLGKGAEKLQLLLACLATDAERPFARDELAEMFWPDLPGGAARRNLRQLLFRLRQWLQDEGLDHPFVLFDGETVRFNPRSDFFLDVEAMTGASPCAGEAPSTRCTVCLPRLKAGFAACRGQFMDAVVAPPGPMEEWLTAKRAEYAYHAGMLGDTLSRCLHQAGDIQGALQVAQRLVEWDPWNEAAHRRIIALFKALGNTAAADAQYRHCERIFREQLDIAPLAETRALRASRNDQSVRRASAAGEERRAVAALYVEWVIDGEPESVSEERRSTQAALSAAMGRHGGFPVPSPAGLFAYFGFPHPDEHASLHALRAATEVVQLIHPTARAGVHFGTTVVSDTEPDASGLVSQPAVRLANQAPFGAVSASPAVTALCAGYFQFKAFNDCYLVAAATGARERVSAASGLTTLVGRDTELQRLSRSWENARAGELQCVWVRGEAGVGKSRLVREFLQSLPARVSAAYCSAETATTAFIPLIDLFRRLTGGAADAAAAWTGKAGLDAECAATLQRLLQEEDGSPFPLRKALVEETWVRLLRALAADGPAVLLLEDAHWCDASTLEMLRHLGANRELPLLVLITARASPPPALRPVEELPVLPLSAEQCLAMAHAIAGPHLPVVAERLVRRTGGLPLFVEEVMRAMRVTPAAAATPDSLMELLIARIDAVRDRELLNLCAVLGDTIPGELLAALRPGKETQAGLKRLIEEQWLIPDGSDCRFRHTLIREAAYGMQLKRARETIHREIARMLETRFQELAAARPALLARHLEAAGDLARAFELWLASGQRNMRRGAFVEAAEELHHALALPHSFPGAVSRELEALLPLGVCLINSAGYGAAATREVYARARRIASESGQREHYFNSLWGSWFVAWSCRSCEEARDVALELLQLALEDGSPFLSQRAHAALGATELWMGELASAESNFKRTLALSDPDADQGAILASGDNPATNAHMLLGWTHCLRGDQTRAEAHAQEAIALARRLDHLPSIAPALGFYAAYPLLRNQPAEVQRHLPELIRIGQEHGMPISIAVTDALHGWALCCDGNGAGVAKVRNALAIIHQAMPGVETFYLVILAKAHAALGEFDEALAALESALECMADTHYQYLHSHMLHCRGVWGLARGEPAGPMREWVERGITMAEQQGFTLFAQQARSDLALFP